MAWEKPCGGGLTHKAIRQYPFLLHSPHPKKLVWQAEFIAAGNIRAVVDLEHPVVIFSRKILNGLLLDRARAAGCRLVQGRVKKVETSSAQVQLSINGSSHFADFVVLAAGARNALLPGTTPLNASDLELTVGYFVPLQGSPAGAQSSLADTLKIQFLPDFTGYLWSFPRPQHLSVGICAAMRNHSARELREHIAAFARREQIDTHSPKLAKHQFFSHVLPSPRRETLRYRQIAGRNWALIGDAAAWVDPLTGEGLYYAMRSGELLAEAIRQGHPEDYPLRARQEFAGEMEMALRAAKRFFHDRFLGGHFQTRMVQLLRHSTALRQIVSDLFSGAQDYATLKRRLRMRAPRIFAELLLSHV
jgi:flavin-dependent dehydrogenase